MPYTPLIQFVENIKKLEEEGMDSIAIIMVYIGIDMMCRLSLPLGETRQTRRHFKDWVNEYMETHPDQPYAYEGDDLYAARCAVLHNYGAEADIHSGDQNIKIIGYHDGGQHSYNEEIDARLVLLGTKSFINDFVCAVEKFLKQAETDEDLKQRIESRLDQVIASIPLQS